MTPENHHNLSLLIEKVKQSLEEDQQNPEHYLRMLRLASVGGLVGGIAHSFNNILGGILGYAQLLKEERGLPEDAYRQAGIIEKAAKRASRLVGNLQLLTQKRLYQRQLVDPVVIVDEVASIVENAISRHIEVRTSCQHGNTRIFGDVPSLCQALLNLCLNAKEAMPEGGKLTIETEVLAGVTSMLAIRVSDTGDGIPPEALPHLFEPLYALPAESHRTGGLTLAIAEAIVKDHEGTMEVESQPGKGCTFTILLPIASSIADQQRRELKKKETRGKGELIMVVDDEEELREMAKQIFEKKGFRVLIAGDAHAAVDMYREHARDIRLVILDMILPGVDGPRVYRELRNINSEPKIILTSGYINHPQFQEIIEHDADAFIAKPWDLPDLIRETTRVLKNLN